MKMLSIKHQQVILLTSLSNLITFIHNTLRANELTKIEDHKIKELIEEYQNSGESLSKIIQMVSEFVYNFPRIRFNQTSDVCGDFYCYFFQKLPPLLLKYTIQSHPFISWFAVVLRRHYINWGIKNQNKSLTSTHYIDNYIDHQNHNSSDQSEIDKSEIKKVMNSLPKKVRVVLKLHFFDFFDGSDLKEASEIFERDPSTLLEKYDALLEYTLTQYEKEKEAISKVNSSYNHLLHYKEMLSKLSESLSDEKEEIENKVAFYQTQHQKAIDHFKRFYISIKPDLISDLLGITTNAVHNLIYRGKRLLKEKLKDYIA